MPKQSVRTFVRGRRRLGHDTNILMVQECSGQHKADWKAACWFALVLLERPMFYLVLVVPGLVSAGKWSGSCSQAGHQHCVTHRPEEWSRPAQNRTPCWDTAVLHQPPLHFHTLSLSLSLFLPRSLSLSLSVCLSVPLSIYVSLSYQSDRVNTEPLSTFFPLSRITKPTVLKHRRVMSCVFLCLLHPAIKIKNTKARKGREQITIFFECRQHASINDS